MLFEHASAVLTPQDTAAFGLSLLENALNSFMETQVAGRSQSYPLSGPARQYRVRMNRILNRFHDLELSQKIETLNPVQAGDVLRESHTRLATIYNGIPYALKRKDVFLIMLSLSPTQFVGLEPEIVNNSLNIMLEIAENEIDPRLKSTILENLWTFIHPLLSEYPEISQRLSDITNGFINTEETNAYAFQLLIDIVRRRLHFENIHIGSDPTLKPLSTPCSLGEISRAFNLFPDLQPIKWRSLIALLEYSHNRESSVRLFLNILEQILGQELGLTRRDLINTLDVSQL